MVSEGVISRCFCFMEIITGIYFDYLDARVYLYIRGAIYGYSRVWYKRQIMIYSLTHYPFTITDWTHSLTKYLRDQLSKLSDYYQSHFGGITSSQLQQRMTPEVEQSQRYWNYTVRLANWLYEVNRRTLAKSRFE